MSHPHLEELIHRAWPDGLSVEDEAAWAAATPARRDTALARLGALLDYESDLIQATPAAVRAGTSATTFFRLGAQWRETRSLAKLLPHGGAGRKPRSGNSAPDELRDAVRALVKVSHSKSREAIVKELQTRFKDVKVHTIRAVVALEEVASRRARARFGHRILVDAVVIDFELPGKRTARATVDIVVDEELGLILGLCRPERYISLWGRWQRLLVEVGCWAETALPEWRHATGNPELRIVIPDLGALEILRHLQAIPKGKDEVYDIGERRTGRLVHAALAGRIGRFILRPRLETVPKFEVRAEVDDTPPFTAAMFDAIVAREVASHNARVLYGDADPTDNDTQLLNIDAFAAPSSVLAELRAVLLPSVASEQPA